MTDEILRAAWVHWKRGERIQVGRGYLQAFEAGVAWEQRRDNSTKPEEADHDEPRT